jgi:7-keto-8-aminopelargonate synthetase-like enzyme
MANLGVLSALGGANVYIYSDALNHASIIDGCRLAAAAGATVATYAHADVAALEDALGAGDGRRVVVTDSVFSMDGDWAPVRPLADVCRHHDALLVLDEAHAVLGPHPSDLGCELLRVGTLSKTLGSLGGFVAGPRPLIDVLVNRCRPFTYTTALSPADTAAARAALGVLRSAEGDGLLARLRAHVERVGGSRRPPSPIFPVVIGDERAALEAAAALARQGLLVPAIRPPTVPPRTSRLRVSLSAAHTGQDVERLITALDDMGLSAR